MVTVLNMVLNTENGSLDLTEEELVGAVIPDEDWDAGVEGYSLLLVGQVLGRRLFTWIILLL